MDNHLECIVFISRRIIQGLLIQLALTSFDAQAQPCHEILEAKWEKATITSPGYPLPYEMNLNCSWLIIAEKGSQIELRYSVVDIEAEYDALKVYDGKDEMAPLLSELHGNIYVRTATISSLEFLFLRFISDDSVSKRGFRAHFRLALQAKMNVTSVIQSCLATTTITRAVRNEDSVPREVEFRVLFPHEAYITKYEMTIGEVEYFGTIERKTSVRQKYREINVQWVSMGYVSSTKDLAKRFFTRVLLQPGETIKFEIAYQQLLQRRLGRYTNAVIITREFLLSDLAVDIYICARSNLAFVQVPATEDAGSLSYVEQFRIMGRKDFFPKNVRVSKEGNVAHISYRSTRTGATEPISTKKNVFVTHYDVERGTSGTLSVFGGEYFAAFFAPSIPNLIRRIVFVLDVSGSMAGTKIQQVKIAMRNILNGLTRRDSFNIVQFESVVRAWRPVGLVPATPAAKLSARRYVNSFDPEGRTNINDALVTGLRLLSQGASNEPLRRRIDVNAYRDFIFFLGDGKPTVGVRNIDAILKDVRSTNRRGYGINAIGFGRNVDVQFLRKLTRENEGKWRIIYDDDESHLQIQNFLTELGIPTMTNIAFTYDPNQVNYTTQRQNLVLVNGGEVAVYGRLLSNFTDEYIDVTITGRTFKRITNNFRFHVKNKITKCESIADKLLHEFIEKGYGITKLEETLRKLRQSTDSDESGNIEEELTDISLEFDLVTPVTSLVVRKKNDTDEEKKEMTVAEEPNKEKAEPTLLPPGELRDDGVSGETQPWVFEGDPHFIVALGNNITVCFTWNGTDGQIYNLLNDPITGVTLNGLIRYGPPAKTSPAEGDCPSGVNKKSEDHADSERKAFNRSEGVESYFVMLGLVFPKEGVKIKVTPRKVHIEVGRIPKQKIEETLPASDEEFSVLYDGVGIKAYNITKVHTFLNVTLNQIVTFVINMKRGRNLPENKKRPGLIDHLDLDVVGHGNLSPQSEGLFGVFPTDATRNFKGKKDNPFPVARLRRPRKQTILQYRKREISVDKITIDDPYSKVPRECWFTYEETLVTGKQDGDFEVNDIFQVPAPKNSYRAKEH